MNAPPPYPRIPHLVGGRGTEDDLVLAARAVASLLGEPVLVEEKVDGANVVLWTEGGRVEVALRSGPGAMDRAGQLGPLRAWAAEHDDMLRQVLVDGTALYAEWLLLTHSSSYDRLPSYLVALDLWRPSTGFLTVGERDSACAARRPDHAAARVDRRPRLGRLRRAPARAVGVGCGRRRGARGSQPGRPGPAGQAGARRVSPARRRRVAPRPAPQPPRPRACRGTEQP